MPSKPIIVTLKGEITELRVPQPEAPRPIRRWLLCAARVALRKRTAHFAMKHGGAWHVHHCYGNVDNPCCTEAIKTFPNEDAAAMWLIHQRAA